MIVADTAVEMELRLALRLLGCARTSGIVTIRSDGREAELVLVEGSVLQATSTTTARLGESLVGRGVITAEVLEDALRHQRRKKVKQPIATILLELGVVSKAVAEAEIETQITRVLQDVFAWERSRLHFQPTRPDAEHQLFPEACQLEALVTRLAWVPPRD